MFNSLSLIPTEQQQNQFKHKQLKLVSDEFVLVCIIKFKDKSQTHSIWNTLIVYV